ncbi:hypothetical protein MKX73_19240 [Solibacillus sp. FSL W7-1436]|uniref:hypothetical protein n=1 Tax=Solibacillus sp. FSL W7-1436 TaxID=2921705 RepID=UPI0030F51EFE
MEEIKKGHLTIRVLHGKEAKRYRKQNKLNKSSHGYIDIQRYFKDLEATKNHIVYVLIYKEENPKGYYYNVVKRHELFHAEQLALGLIKENSKENHYKLEKDAYMDGLAYVKENYNFFYHVWYRANMYMSLFAEAIGSIKFHRR